LEQTIYADEDPIPVAVADLGELVASKPKGEVVTELKWDRLTPADFERLLFNLISTTEGYENPQWLMHTNAPDDGRDLSVYRVYKDRLSGPKRERCIIACKHYTSRNVSQPEVSVLCDQMTHWEPPRVDCLILATSGNFTTPVVHWIEKHNQRDSALTIEPWSGSTFERLLAQRPELVAEFNLR
jgi:Restriction endonuclease